MKTFVDRGVEFVSLYPLITVLSLAFLSGCDRNNEKRIDKNSMSAAVSDTDSGEDWYVDGGVLESVCGNEDVEIYSPSEIAVCDNSAPISTPCLEVAIWDRYVIPGFLDCFWVCGFRIPIPRSTSEDVDAGHDSGVEDISPREFLCESEQVEIYQPNAIQVCDTSGEIDAGCAEFGFRVRTEPCLELNFGCHLDWAPWVECYLICRIRLSLPNDGGETK